MTDHPTENPFLEAGPDAILLDELTLAGRTSVLERLGPAQFRSKGFSFIGFLETLYDHVAEQTNSGAPIPPSPAATPADAAPPDGTPMVDAPAIEASVAEAPVDEENAVAQPVTAETQPVSATDDPLEQ